MIWQQALGWAGSALLVYSVLQTRVLRFRTLNLTASAVLAVFNALVEVWPMVGMNAVLVCINAWFLVKMLRTKRAGRAFDWMAVAPGDPYLDRVLKRWRADIERFRPDAASQLADPATRCALIFCGEVTVGLVAFRPDVAAISADDDDAVLPAAAIPAADVAKPAAADAGPSAGDVAVPAATDVAVPTAADAPPIAQPTLGHLVVDYVIESYRDYTPGRFVYSPSGPLAAAGLSQVQYLRPLPAVVSYLRAVGFAEPTPGLFTRTIP